jgi:hypothetical protein
MPWFDITQQDRMGNFDTDMALSESSKWGQMSHFFIWCASVKMFLESTNHASWINISLKVNSIFSSVFSTHYLHAQGSQHSQQNVFTCTGSQHSQQNAELAITVSGTKGGSHFVS